MSAWIEMIQNDNVLRVHSLRLGTMNGHMVLYKAVLHNEKIQFQNGFKKH